jgi:pimeloyl-ACP methyl ester carboxylesterase
MPARPTFHDLYPFQGRYFHHEGLDQHYLDEGSGDALLMLHGNPSWSFYYRELIGKLRGRYRTIAPDHIGCGLSDKPDDTHFDYTLERHVDRLEALVEHLEIEGKLTLVLHDWGGMIGMGFAMRHPERIARVVLLNTAAFPLDTGRKLPLALRLVRTPGLGTLLVRGFNAFALGAALLAVTRRRMTGPLRRAYCAPYDSWAHRIATLRFVQDIPLGPGDPAYALLAESEAQLAGGLLADVPAMICWGMRDFVLDPSYLERWIRFWPHAEVHRLSDCGHYVLEDANAEIGLLVEEFLDKHPIGADRPPASRA